MPVRKTGIYNYANNRFPDSAKMQAENSAPTSLEKGSYY